MGLPRVHTWLAHTHVLTSMHMHSRAHMHTHTCTQQSILPLSLCPPPPSEGILQASRLCSLLTSSHVAFLCSSVVGLLLTAAFLLNMEAVAASNHQGMAQKIKTCIICPPVLIDTDPPVLLSQALSLWAAHLPACSPPEPRAVHWACFPPYFFFF